MDFRERGELLDLLYEAPAAPRLWAPVLERLADATGGTSAWLSNLNLATGAGEGLTARIDPLMPLKYKAYYGSINPFLSGPKSDAMVAAWRPEIIHDHSVVERDTLVRTEYFNDFMRPQDVHSVLIADLDLQGCDIASININRPQHRGPFDASDIETLAWLHDHLIRAFRLTRKFAGLRAQSADLASALDAMAGASLVLDASGRVQRLNRAAEDLLAGGHGLGVVAGRLCATNAEAARRLERAIAVAASPDSGARRGDWIAVPSPRRRWPLSLALTPLSANDLAVFGAPRSVLLCITDLEADLAPPERQLMAVFAFTPAEARLAKALMEGNDLKTAAGRLGCSLNTVRVHLSHIFEKTGVNRQADLLRLMARLGGKDASAGALAHPPQNPTASR